MGKKILILQVAGLSKEVNINGLRFQKTQSVFPAVTCTVQASFRTASLPSDHGMIANGIYLRDLRKPLFWEQSSCLVKGKRIWEDFRRRGKKVALLFWQQSLGEDADIILSPAPIHKHHGGMIQAFYSKPDNYYEKLCRKIGGKFKLSRYWGPMASWKVGDWIAKAVVETIKNNEVAPDLCMAYLPTLDYDLQRKCPDNKLEYDEILAKAVNQLNEIYSEAVSANYDVIIFGDYDIKPASGAVLPNLALKNADLMKVRYVAGMAYPDFYTSKAFAVVDHEVAHVYTQNDSIQETYDVLAKLPGVGRVLDRAAQQEMGIAHKNSGELVIAAEQGKWFAYPWWEGKKNAPDYSTHVDIHNKPGYDPCELFWGWPPGSVSLDTRKIRGSHGLTGPGREVVWASTRPLEDNINSLIDLSRAVQKLLD